jgi:hypothetical protein
MSPCRHRRWLAALTLLPVAAFAGLMGAAMSVYPGGTWEDPGLVGHRFWANYFCDLLRPEALNGQPNPHGALLSQAGLVSLAVALFPFFLAVSCLFAHRRRLALFIRVAGAVASLGGLGVVFVPSHRYGALAHGAVLLLAAVPGIAAGVSSVLGLLAERRRVPLVSALGGLTLLLAIATALVFARQLQLGVETTPPLAPLQKILALTAMAWMAATAARVLRERTTVEGQLSERRPGG